MLNKEQIGLLIATVGLAGCNFMSADSGVNPDHQLQKEYNAYPEMGATAVRGGLRFTVGDSLIEVRNYSETQLDQDKMNLIFSNLLTLPQKIKEGVYKGEQDKSIQTLFYLGKRPFEYHRINLVPNEKPFPKWKPNTMSNDGFTRIFLNDKKSVSFIRVVPRLVARSVPDIVAVTATNSFVTESCQAMIGVIGKPNVETSVQNASERFVQEVFCNGIGMAADFKNLGYDYKRYSEFVAAEGTIVINRKHIPQYILPEDVYKTFPETKDLFTR